MTDTSPQWIGYTKALNQAGVETQNGRGCWGAVTPSGDVVVTSWTDAEIDGGYRIWKPRTNRGGLKNFWEEDRMSFGYPVRLIVVRQKGNAVLGQDGRKVRDAMLMAGHWRVAKRTTDGIGEAIVVRS
jgi:hypothetical protein